MNRNEILDQLFDHVVSVDFTKVSGDRRVMKCTLMESIIPPSTSEGPKRIPSEETISAWDVENNGWRSFRVDSVNSVSVVG